MTNSINEFEKLLSEIKKDRTEKGKIVYKQPLPTISLEESTIITKESKTAVEYTPKEKIENSKADRQKSVNKLIEDMIVPLKKEQSNKIKYRGKVLVSFLIYFAIITLLIFGLILVFFISDGLSNDEAKVSQFLVTGFFVNLISLAVVVFKYLFDDKNSLMKDMIQLIVETLKENKE